MRVFRTAAAIIGVIVLLYTGSVFAQEFTSGDFNDADPVIVIQGGKSTSASFQLYSGTGQVAIGQSASNNFTYRSGFFYFPTVTTPVLQATGGDGSASLSWTAAVGYLGFSISGYSLGRSTASTGPFTYQSIGNTLAKTDSGLVNNSTYYYIIRALDAFGNTVATSSVVSVTPQSLGSTGGGGGQNITTGGSTTVTTGTGSITINGYAFSNAVVGVLENGQLIKTIPADAQGAFAATLNNLNPGEYIYSFYSQDTNGNKSTLFSVPVSVQSGHESSVPGIVLPPIVTIDKTAAKRGEQILISGQTLAHSEVLISIGEQNPLYIKITSADNGIFAYNFNTSALPDGTYTVRARVNYNTHVSDWSKYVSFTVGKETSAVPSGTVCSQVADINGDCKVDLVDFSILLYWFNQPHPPARIDLNNDGVVDIRDFSIMMYFWTG